MIIRCDFKEFEDLAKEIDKEAYYPNISIFRAEEGEPPSNKEGDIYIPSTKDPGAFSGLLTHEVGHSVFDPITVKNYIDYAFSVKTELGLDDKTALMLSNAISDMYVEYHINRHDKLRSYRAEYLKSAFNSAYPRANNLQKILWAYDNAIYGLNLPIDRRIGKEIKEIIDIVKNELSRDMGYVKIAKVIMRLLKKMDDSSKGSEKIEGKNESGENEGYGSGTDKGTDKTEAPEGGESYMPIKPKDVDEVVEKIISETSSFYEAKEKIKILAAGLDYDDKIKVRRVNLLRAFYEAKAKEVRISLDYPKTNLSKSSRLGYRKWTLSDGYLNLSMYRTIQKHGINIPLITTLTPRAFDKFIGNKESVRPVDLVVSIDVSGSVDKPEGLMCNVADYEVIMFYALVDEAKRINQRIGLTTWDFIIRFTTLPNTLSYTEVDPLKDLILRLFIEGPNTEIKSALEQAAEYPDKLFIFLTDGEVKDSDLLNVDNAMFFLITPANSAIEKFVSAYGKERVVVIDDITKIPRVVLNWYRGVFHA